MPSCTFWVPIRQNRLKIGREKSILRFFQNGGVWRFWRSIWGVKISNRRNGVRVSQNHENHVFEYICLDLVESSGESPPILRKMFRGHLGVEKSIFQNPDFGPKRNFEWKWKSTLQRMASFSKLGFWEIFGGLQKIWKKKKSATRIFFFPPKIKNMEPKEHFGSRSIGPPTPPFGGPTLGGCGLGVEKSKKWSWPQNHRNGPL